MKTIPLDDLISGDRMQIKKTNALRINHPTGFKQAFDTVNISEGLKYGQFVIPYRDGMFNGDEELIETITKIMNMVNHRPATLGDLISCIIDNPWYATDDEKILRNLPDMIALGSIGKINNISCVPQFRVHAESLGSSIDRDLMRLYHPELCMLYFQESKNPLHYHLMHSSAGHLFLGVLME